MHFRAVAAAVCPLRCLKTFLANIISPSVDPRSDDTAFGREHSHGKIQYISGKQVLVRAVS